MGNSAAKESRSSPSSQSRPGSIHQPASPTRADASQPSHPSVDRAPILYTTRSRGSRRDSFLGLGGNADSGLEARKETKAERDARRAEKEKVARAKERERSLKEESVDGGYLVTLGTYTGTEDFSKVTVRQLMLERRIAPFWRGLNDHSDSWTEHQLVAAARGLPIPAPDEIPPEDSLAPPNSSPQPIAFHSSSRNTNYDNSNSLSASQPAHSYQQATSPPSLSLGTSPLFRGRSKTLASLTSKNGSQSDVSPQEIRLPHEPYINGQPVEANLYKDVLECPICFLYYPPYLNKTRCCDQPICSECFVQIKRPDPHPPEHTDPNAPPLPDAQQQVEEGLLVSEPAQCPFCVQPEFGVSYESPPFRRGLAYASHGRASSFVKSAMSSSTSLTPPTNGNMPIPASRRRATSLSANAPQVITTDKVRPDWAKKLSDARAHAARKSAAATALHNAAYIMGGNGALEPRFGIGRRRRNFLTGDVHGVGNAPPGAEGMSLPNMELLIAALEGQSSSSRLRHGSSDFPARVSSRQNRTDELEEIMLLEAIRQSLAAEEERKRKEDKESAKETKKEDKKKAKEQKKADKAVKKSGYSSPTANSNRMFYSASPSTSSVPQGSSDVGKGKEKATDVGSDPTTSSLTNVDILSEPFPLEGLGTTPKVDPQRFLEQSRAHLGSEVSLHQHGQSQPQPIQSVRSRHISDASSSGSSFLDSAPASLRHAGSDSSFDPSPNISGQNLPFGSQNHDPSGGALNPEGSFGFGSLAAVLGKEGPSTGSETREVTQEMPILRSRGGTGESSQSAGYAKHQQQDTVSRHPPFVLRGEEAGAVHSINQNDFEKRHHTDLDILDYPGGRQVTQ